MKYLSIILLLTLSCCETEEKLTSFQIEIYPAFDDYSTFKINLQSDTSILEFTRFKKFENIDEALSGKKTVLNTSKLSSKKTPQLFKAIESFKDDEKRNNGYTDGITSTVIKNYKNKSDTSSIHVPFRDKNPNHYVYLDKLFEVLEETDSYDQQIYFEAIKSYFDYGLPIKQTNSNPKTYRVWGALTTNEEKDLKQLTESINENELVIFDFRNYQGMGSLLYHEFIQLNKRNKNVYYLYDREINEDLEYVGNNKVYKTIEEILAEYKKGYR